MILTFLGTGTSQGIPVIGCKCATCVSPNPKDKRLRCALHISYKQKSFIIDIGPDFRQQMLTNQIDHLDFALLTHEHNDHTAGLDDVRPINFNSGNHLDIYAMQRVVDDVRRRFEYVFAENPYPGAPRINLHTLESNKRYSIDGIEIAPIAIFHGTLPILGFRIGGMAYCTDTSFISEAEKDKLKDLDVLIISALRNEPHYTHFTLQQAIAFIEEVQPKKAYLIHMSHVLGPVATWENDLPSNIKPAYDGLIIEVEG